MDSASCCIFAPEERLQQCLCCTVRELPGCGVRLQQLSFVHQAFHM